MEHFHTAKELATSLARSARADAAAGWAAAETQVIRRPSRHAHSVILRATHSLAG